VTDVAAALGDERSARPLVADLANPLWIDALEEATDQLEVGLAVANAGVAFVGRYLDMDPGRRRAILEVNCTATVDLASWALPAMVERGRGGFVATSSGSALAGTGGVALYSATKAFSVNLIEALGWELADSGVDTLAVVAPTMDTPMFPLRRGRPGARLRPHRSTLGSSSRERSTHSPQAAVGWPMRGWRSPPASTVPSGWP
jgi:short-subunit dehydrogenase